MIGGMSVEFVSRTVFVGLLFLAFNYNLDVVDPERVNILLFAAY